MSGANTYSLAHVPLLADLKPDELAKIERMCRWKSHDPQEQIIDRQSESKDVFFIVSGDVRVIIHSLSGREVTLDDLSEGSHFGELSALDDLPRTASVVALDRTLVAALPQRRFIDLLGQHPPIAFRVMRSMCRIIRASTDRIIELSTLGANGRVHAELLRRALATMTFDNTAEIRPIPVHGDMAGRVGTTRETVARTMNDLARRGIVERGKDVLKILDIEKLQDMVDEMRGD